MNAHRTALLLAVLCLGAAACGKTPTTPEAEPTTAAPTAKATDTATATATEEATAATTAAASASALEIPGLEALEKELWEGRGRGR